MKAPNKIYTRIGKDGNLEAACEKSYAGCETEFVSKDALLEWARKKITELEIAMETGADDPAIWGQRNMCKQLIDKLNSL